MNTALPVARTVKPSQPEVFLIRMVRSLAALFSPMSQPSPAAPETDPQPPQPWAKPAAMLLASQIAIGLAIAVITGLLVMHLRDHALTEATNEQQRLSLILADQAERAFEAVELVQTGLVERLQHDDVRTPAAFRQYMSSAIIQTELSGRGRILPQLEAINIIDSLGNLINSSRSVLGPAVNVADREHFTALRDDPDRSLFVSQPLQSRSNGKWTAYVARRVAGPDGEFLGLILGSLLLRYFEELYHAASFGAQAAIVLRRQDGILLARDPPIELSPSQPKAIRLVPSELVGAKGITYWQTSPIDGQYRLIAERSLLHDAVVVGVSNTITAILAEWRRLAIGLVATAIVLELVVAGAGLLVVQQMRNQQVLGLARAARSKAEAATKQAEAELAVAQERSRTDREIGIQNLRFEAALRNMSQALFAFDATATLVVVNRRAAELFGVPPESIVPGMTFDDFGTMLATSSNLVPADVERIHANVHRLRAEGKREAHLCELADGRTLAVNFAPIENDGWLTTLEDTTERRQVEAKITHMAHHDALTELPNRVLFHDRLHDAMARSRRGEPSAVLCLDLDHFKDVNDTLGHPIGDALLQAVTQRLYDEVRATDTVARLGGDEFAIVQSRVDEPLDTTSLATRLIEAFRAPFEIAGHQVMIGASIGIAVIPDDGEDADQIMRNADMALYRAKADGRGRYRFFEAGMDAIMQARRNLEVDLRKALAAGEFQLYYQPLMNIKSGTIIGFEALARWLHPERGLLQPAHFIPFAEETGLIVPLGNWALRQACMDAATWPGDIKVAVNVSVVQFGSGALVEDVAAALHGSGLEPARLELEIVESVMLNDTDATLVILYQLRDLGVGIAMDDFGTGYSSLSYLRRFPFSKVKIDRSFIADLGRDGGSDAIVTAVTELCETLGMLTLAEGVETEEQLRLLRSGLCGEAQGYLFSKPKPASEVAALCRQLSRAGKQAGAGLYPEPWHHVTA
ncbi:MAG: EAL domain-containing protein [Acetobacteraceae bacterium]